MNKSYVLFKNKTIKPNASLKGRCRLVDKPLSKLRVTRVQFPVDLKSLYL